MKRIAHLVAVVIAVVPGAAGAQSWSELHTLTFIPAGLARSTAAEPVGSAGGVSGEPSDESPDPSPERVIARIQAAGAAIEAERAANGENSIELVPLFESLADIYLEVSGYGDAIAALEQAQQVIRRHHGLYSLDQARPIERIIEIEMSLRPSEESIELESYLRELVQRNPGDPRNPEILTKMAGRQMEVARHVLIHGVPPQFSLNVNVGVGPSLPGVSSRRTTRSVAASMLRQARFNYGSAILTAMFDDQASLSQLFELEDSIIDSYYFELMNPGLNDGGSSYWGNAGRLYSGAIRALGARLRNIRNYSGAPEAVAAALIETADWHLMFGSFGRAMGIYEQALADIRAEGAGEERITAMFSPEQPVPLPAVASNANVFHALRDVQGYFDVEIEINRFGGVRDVTITGRSPNASDSIERRLRKFVYQSRFRPRYVDGEWLTTDRFAMRYEFGYSSS
ncbi:MAG TPA: hypothetical protein VMR74_02620 [Gammaproteobacteria bacterium]|nr:hypothetical protein [Gammaproteobacteria bacterium]